MSPDPMTLAQMPRVGGVGREGGEWIGKEVSGHHRASILPAFEGCDV